MRRSSTTRSTHKSVQEARARLPELLDAAERGEATIIARRGKPVAAIVPLDVLRERVKQPSLLSLYGSGRGLWGDDPAKSIAAARAEADRF